MSKAKGLRGRAPTVLTIIGALGVASTMVLTISAAPKAAKRKAKAEEEKIKAIIAEFLAQQKAAEQGEKTDSADEETNA